MVKESKDLNSFGRSTLKVRWKDMIEISNVVHFVNDDNDEVTRTTKTNGKPESSSSSSLSPSVDTSSSTTAKQLSSAKLNDSGEEINDIYGDRDADDDEEEEEEEEDDEDEDDDDDDEDSEDTEDSSEMSVEEEKNRVSSRLVQETATNKPGRVERLIISEKRTAPNGQSVTMNVSKTSEHLLLEPLHATGREFEKEMNDRIEKLNRIKVKTIIKKYICSYLFSSE